MSTGAAPCLRPECGHPDAAHRHYRRGRNCSACGCPRFQRWPRLPDLWWGLRQAPALLRSIR